MTLPSSARDRLGDLLLQEAPSLRIPERIRHTLPVGQKAWRRHRDALVGATEDFSQLCTRPAGDFNTVRAWVIDLASARKRVRSLLLALEPFVPFDSSAADDLIQAVDKSITVTADNVKRDASGSGATPELLIAISWWRSRDSDHDESAILGVAFGLPAAPVDDKNEFRADWVLQHYAYKNGSLIARVIRHLDSLGVPEVGDVLVGISMIGDLLDCEDPISAYIAMDSFVSTYLEAPPEVAERVRDHLDKTEGAVRRARQMANRAYATAVAAQNDAETRAFALADMYKRLIEGPFRQYAWGLYCLDHASWEPPPTLGSMRERLIARGGLLSAIANIAVLPGLRNSEAHETLVWEGLDEEFVTESGRLSPAQVATALVEADCFAVGCEAGMAAARSLAITPDGLVLPDPGETGRMPAWRRVRAYFGTNNLRLTEEHLNARNATLRIEQLRLRDVNPCFQALLTAHRLLPRIETFSVGVQDAVEIRITVSAEALEATMPIWEHALPALDRMPFATFLPANFDARRRVEPEGLALRSATWIALDDVLDAIDGSPPEWDESVLELLDVRLRVVEVAVSQLAKFVGSTNVRISSVICSVGELREWINRVRPSDPNAVEVCESLQRLRIQWRTWGPVPRHPLVPEPTNAEFSENRPTIRRELFSKDYRTI
jgi:hypothetical protein